MRALRQRSAAPVRFSGVGGREMAAAGLDSLFPIDDFSIIGFAAIPAAAAAHSQPHGADRSRGAGAPAACAGHHRQPGLHAAGRALRALVRPLDPDHRLRVAVGLGLARRAARARCARYIDHVLALLPFEPDVHRKLGGPPCSYVGHPLIEEVVEAAPERGRGARAGMADPPVVLAMPGSRSSEVGKAGRRLRRGAGAALRERVGPIEVVVPTVPHLLAQVTQATSRLADQAPHRGRAGREAGGLARGAGGAGQIRHHHAGARGRRRADGRGLQGVARSRRGGPAAGSGAVLHPGQSGDRRKTSCPSWCRRTAPPEALADALAPLLGDTPERRRQVEAFATLDAIMEIGSRAPAARAADIVLGIAPAASGRAVGRAAQANG